MSDRCPECDFELVYVRAGDMRIFAVLSNTITHRLHATDSIVCTSCGWWRGATADDAPAVGAHRRSG